VVFARAGVDIEPPCTCLALSADAQGIAVALEVPAEHTHAVRMRLGEGARLLELTAALEALPEQFAIGVGSAEPSLPAAANASPDDVRALVDRAERQRQPFSVRWTIAREVALEHAADLDDQLEDAIVALGSVFVLLTDEGPPAGPRLPDARGREGKHAPADDHRKGEKRRARALQRDEEREHEREREPENDVEPESTREHAGPLRRAPSSLRTPSHKPLRPGLRRRPSHDDRARGHDGGTIDKGARVRVLDGPFAGKVGVVHELDGKGGARVMLGLLAVRFAVKDLALSVERRTRPLLSSSHRKPVPVRS
jgi:KOW motif